MKYSGKVLATAGLITATVAVAPAFAQNGHTLSLRGPASAEVGRSAVIQASGTVPADVMLNRYLNVYAIPARVLATCPATFQNASQVAHESSAEGGDTVALSIPVEGSFSTSVAYNPSHAGAFVLCGYVHEGVETMAAAQHDISVSGGGSVARIPASTSRPKLKRSGSSLVCSRGRWSGNPTSYAYRWRVNGRKQAGAKGRRLRVTRKLRGKRVRCDVTARNAAGAATASSKTLRA